MDILVSGSLAYDRIMDFPGKFADHILPDKIHILNVCFTINGLRENFGGTAGNIAYGLSLFDERPSIIAAAGRDFQPYAIWLDRNRISTVYIRIIEDEFTAGAYITTDLSDNQITAFNPGAMKHSATFDVTPVEPAGAVAIIAPGNLEDMYSLSKAYRERGIRYIFDPGQSLPGWEGRQISAMMDGAEILICNDYELELILDKTAMTTAEILARVRFLIVTKGEKGSRVLSRGLSGGLDIAEIPAVRSARVMDPTGAGDAYRAGLIKGLLIKEGDIIHAARMGAACATCAIEDYGTQTYLFTRESFNERFAATFGTHAY